MAQYDKNKPEQYDDLIRKASDTYGVSYDLLRKQLWVESRFNPKAQSPTGPKGIAQFTKATGAAYGLMTDEDFFDPAKSIDAAGRHLSDLVKKFNGDELKAALAYNQGEGPNGKGQLAGYDTGDFSKIGDEGLNYMRQLADVAQSPKLKNLEDFGGITPKAKAVSASDWDVLTEGITKKPAFQVGDGVPEVTGMQVEGADVAPTAKSFSQSFWEQEGETLDERESRSTFFGLGQATEAELQNSTLGVAIRAAKMENGIDVLGDVFNPTRWNPHTFSREELDKIRAAGVQPEYYPVITGGSADNLDTLINMALENQKADQAKVQAGVGAQLAAGLIGTAGDPLTYVPMVGAARGAKLVNKMFVTGTQAAVGATAGEALRSSVAGGDAHLAEAAIGGAVFGSGMAALSDVLGRALGNTATNEFHGPATRLEARETARNTDGDDLSRMPIQDGEPVHEFGDVRFADVPNEESSARLADGSILIGENPLNPKTQQRWQDVDPEPARSAWGASLGGFSEIGYKLLRTENAKVRGIAQDLVRSPVGMQSGDNGKFGPTSSDVHERLKYVDNKVYNDMDDLARQALREPEYATRIGVSERASRQDVYRRVALAIEDGSGTLRKELTETEGKLFDLLKTQFDTKREMMENPAMFGNNNATNIFPGSRFKGTYIPNVYSTHAKQMYIQELGSPEALQEAIKRSWLTSYYARPEVKKRIDEMLLEQNENLKPSELQAAVEKYANDTAYGISHTEAFDRSSVIEENLDGLVGVENNAFLEARNLFDSDMSIMLPTGKTFSVNDLREFDMDKILPAYNRRVNGDIAIMAGTGKTTKELKDEVLSLMQEAGDNGKLKGEAKALQDVVKMLTGRARLDDHGVLQTMTRSLNDLSFFAKNAYMGVQNLTEIGGMLARGNIRAALHGIPVFRDMAFRNKKMSGTEIKEMHGIVFGRELDDSIRPSREDIIDRLRSSTDASQFTTAAVGSMKYYTQELATRSPWTKVLNGTSNYIVDAARQGYLSDIVEHSLTGSKRKFDDRWLKSASISPEQWEGIKSLIRENVKQGPDGRYTIANKKAFQTDPRSMDLWRLGDKIADETILRPHKLSSQDSKAYGAGVKMVMQFKNFVIKSINGRFIRSFYEATKNHRAIDQALSLMMSIGLAGGYYMAQAHVKAAAMQDEAARDYLKQALDPAMIAYGALSRSSTLGGPMGVANILGGIAGYDQAKMVRSTILPKAPVEKDPRAIQFGAAQSDPVMNVAGSVLQQIPAFGFAANVFASGYNLKGYLQADTTPDETDYRTGMYATMRELVPNDPITQRLLLGVFEEQGIHIKSNR